jgi:hypothetical protein
VSNGRYIHEKAAQAVMVWLHMAEDDLIGHEILTTTGESGICRGVRLDDFHGLCFTLDEGDGKRWSPVSTIKHHGPKNADLPVLA